MFILEPDFTDKFKKIKRGPQIITPKDIGTIITETGINKNSIVLDAGGGSGSLSCFLANITKKVYCYEKKVKDVHTINLFLTIKIYKGKR